MPPTIIPAWEMPREALEDIRAREARARERASKPEEATRVVTVRGETLSVRAWVDPHRQDSHP